MSFKEVVLQRSYVLLKPRYSVQTIDYPYPVLVFNCLALSALRFYTKLFHRTEREKPTNQYFCIENNLGEIHLLNTICRVTYLLDKTYTMHIMYINHPCTVIFSFSTSVKNQFFFMLEGKMSFFISSYLIENQTFDTRVIKKLLHCRCMISFYISTFSNLKLLLKTHQ